MRLCAYCGDAASTDDHVVPKALYPPSKASSRVQRITVPACEACNRSWSDDEVHFRNVLLIAGESNAPVRELWESKARRSFRYADGSRRLRDLATQMVAVHTKEGERHMVFPGRDERVTRVVRKVIRGLCHHHRVLTAVSDGQVWVNVQQFEVPPAFLDEMTPRHVEEDVFKYRFVVAEEEGIHSCWLLNFYERRPFFGIVFHSEQAAANIQAEVTD